MQLGIHDWYKLFSVGPWKGLWEDYQAALFGGGKWSLNSPLMLCARILDATRSAYSTLLADFETLAEETSRLWSEVRVMRAYKTEMERKVGAATSRANDMETRLAVANASLGESERLRRAAEACCFEAEAKLQRQQGLLKLPVKLRLINGGTAVEAYSTQNWFEVLAKLYLPPPSPVTYGCDFGANGDKTVVTVRQGDKVLHVIDVEEERKKAIAEKAAAEEKLKAAFNAAYKPMTWKRYTGGFTWTPMPKTPFDNYDSAQWRSRYEKWQEQRTIHGTLGNHNKRWTAEMDRKLLDAYSRGCRLSDIAMEQKREWEAILYRLAYNAGWPRRWGAQPKFIETSWGWFFKPSGDAHRHSLRDYALTHKPVLFL